MGPLCHLANGPDDSRLPCLRYDDVPAVTQVGEGRPIRQRRDPVLPTTACR